MQVEAGPMVGTGSGVVISSDGLILTNNHVVELAVRGGQATALFLNGQRAPVEIVGRVPSADIALVRVRIVSDLVVAELGRSSDLVVGQQVVAVGSPLGLQGTVTSGIVSALDRPVRAGGERIVESGTVNRAVLGVTVPSGRPAEIGGAVVESVVSDGAAGAAGIWPGEAITKIDDRLIVSGDELVAAIRSSPPGSQIDVTVGAPDGSNQRTVQVTLGTQTLQAAG